MTRAACFRIRFLAPLCAAWAKGRRRRRAEPEMERALVRLAETAPHLLQDVGFLRDAHESTPGRAVLVGRGLRLELRDGAGADEGPDPGFGGRR